MRCAHSWALFGISVATLLLGACAHSEFERQHQRSVSENPAGVELEIRTRGGRQQFAPLEAVQFEEIYTSKYSEAWHIEVLDSLNDASSLDVLHVTDGSTIWNQRRELSGIICCDSRHVWLSQDPVRIPYKLFANRTRANPEGWANPEWHTLHLPNKPGKYQVYVTTERVFGRGDSTTTYYGRGSAVSSNILKLEVK
jgi:hypothetical protein